ncbi:MAG: TonB-dependent receptor, partial [Bacteroidetes bacterium]|nr:TonB-dependent receptor [Bacteroidota bacterium]
VYFTNNFANFDPASFKTPNPRYTWQVPAYGVFDAFAGADIKGNKSLRYSISLGVFNVLDKSFITDAINGTSFDANTATVYMGQGRRYNLSLKISF